MAVAVFGTVGTGTSTANPLNHTHTIASGQSNVLLVAGTHHQGSADTIDSVTWDPAGDNESLTEEIEAATVQARAALYYRVAPANQDDTGYTLRHTRSAGGRCAGAGINFSGVDQSTPVKNSTSEGSSSGNMNVTVTTDADADEFVIDATTKVTNGALTVDGSQTQRWNIDMNSDSVIDAGGSTEGAGTNPTEMDWTHSGTDSNWISIGVVINAVEAAPVIEDIPAGMLAGVA